MPLPADYEERVYAGVLGKIIGVYLGRPFEGWSHERIERELGEINYYVHERLGAPLIVTDDDISGTFTFLRALPENDNDPRLTAAQIGDWWLNTLIENRTILWWGGFGMSTEHTAFMRLKAGLRAPDSGSIATNGAIVAEQIGAQIFIDGWGMVSPGDPAQAAHFARLAASVSHDGEAIYGAQIIAAMEAQAFVEPNLDKLLDTAVGFIPKDSVIFRMIGDMRGWAADSGDDWRATLKLLQTHYGYDKFGGNCHMVPNHAVILLGLLHSNDDFQHALMIANTAGYDTDCNSGNVGCLMGIKNGLAGIDAGPDWRGPVADRILLPTGDGGRAITDAVHETYEIVKIARALAGQSASLPKDGARFHFSLPGSVQGFQPENSLEVRGAVSVANEGGKLALHLRQIAPGRAARVATPTFITPEYLSMGGYGLIASPTLYPGQAVTARVIGGGLSRVVDIGLYARVWGRDNKVEIQRGPTQTLASGEAATLEWMLPDTDGQPIAEIGVEATSDTAANGTILLDWLTWGGAPDVTLGKPKNGGDLWQRAWVDGVSHLHTGWTSLAYRLIQDEGTGLISQGEASWTDYTVSTTILPHLARRIGLAAAVRGLRRYVALVLDSDRRVRLIEQRDGEQTILAEAGAVWEMEKSKPLSLTVQAGRITATFGDTILTAGGDALPRNGGVGLLVDTGHAEFAAVQVEKTRG